MERFTLFAAYVLCAVAIIAWASVLVRLAEVLR